MRILACGDALFSSGNLANRLHNSLVDEFAHADASFANAEFVCPKITTPPMPRRFSTAVSVSALDELMSLGINLVSFANNHTGDFGGQGVVDTIEAAEERGLMTGGIGRSLAAARSARFLDTPKGRIGLVAASSTRAAEATASEPGKDIAPRAGLNPLRWGRAYVLPEEQFRQLQQIDESLGTAAARSEVMRVEVAPQTGDAAFNFGSHFEGSLRIEKGASAHVRYFVDERDSQAILANVRDAANRSDIVIVSIHSHEGRDENWYSPRPASFLEDFARKAIDAGASAFFGHGPHMLRGIEIYKGRPIFYSLGSLLMEFEAGEQVMTPEMYAAYGFSSTSLPSDLHMSRVRNASGELIGFYGDPRFSQGCIGICDFEEREIKVRLLPLDLDLNRERTVERGLPVIADRKLGQQICNNIAAMSEAYGTKLHYDDDGLITVTAGEAA